MADTVDVLGRIRAVQPVAAYASDPAVPDVAWLGDGPGRRWPVIPQRGRTLGERVARACAWAFGQGAARVLAMGSDAPELSAAWLRAAVSALDRHEMVIGPATDGGYHLIGLTCPQPELFRRMPWSTPALLARTLQRARRLGLRVHQLPPIDDLDVPEDLRRYLLRLRARAGRGSGAPAGRAAAYLWQLAAQRADGQLINPRPMGGEVR